MADSTTGASDEASRKKACNEFLKLGRAQYELNRFDLAILDYRRALEADPKSAMAHHLLGYAQFLTGQISAAGKSYDLAVGFSPDAPLIRYNASIVAWALKDKDKALEHLRHLKRIEDANHSDAMLTMLKTDVQFDTLRKLPEVIALLGT